MGSGGRLRPDDKLDVVEPSAAINAIERSLRGLVLTVLGDSVNLAGRLGLEKVTELESRRDEEQRRRAPFAVPSDLLAYTHFYELRKILTSDWSNFSPALGAKKEFDVWADQIEDYRNAPAHSRDLLPYERAMLEGIAGAIQTRVTAFRSEKGPDLNHYPEIASARDSFGLAFESIRVTGLEQILISPMVLHPGDEVGFELTGLDAQGRQLHWEFDASGRTFFESDGNSAAPTWVVGHEDVAITAYVTATLSSYGRYHRHKSYDHRVTFGYQVDPPDDPE